MLKIYHILSSYYQYNRRIGSDENTGVNQYYHKTSSAASRTNHNRQFTLSLKNVTFILLIIGLIIITFSTTFIECRKNANRLKNNNNNNNNNHHRNTNTNSKCDLKKADRCTQILYIYGDPGYQMSNTIQEAEQFCK